MLAEDVQEKGYALLCVAQPQSDCHVDIIEEVTSLVPVIDYVHAQQALCCATE